MTAGARSGHPRCRGGAVIRLVGALLVEVNDELVAAPRRYIAEATLAPLIDDQEDRLPSLPAAPRH